MLQSQGEIRREDPGRVVEQSWLDRRQQDQREEHDCHVHRQAKGERIAITKRVSTSTFLREGFRDCTLLGLLVIWTDSRKYSNQLFTDENLNHVLFGEIVIAMDVHIF